MLSLLSGSDASLQFLPVYEEIYSMLEMQSLPRFIALAKSNVNWKKQAFW